MLYEGHYIAIANDKRAIYGPINIVRENEISYMLEHEVCLSNFSRTKILDKAILNKELKINDYMRIIYSTNKVFVMNWVLEKKRLLGLGD